MKYNKFLLFGILFLFFSIYAYAQNTKPTADAGADRNVIVGQDATLFGSGTDDDGDDITFEWRLIEGPGGSLSELLRDDVQNPTFIPDKVGDYKFSLRTNDGTEFSDSSHVIITANDADPDNTKPISYAGPDRNVNIREETALAGSGSDADGESLLYMWTLLSSPTDSKIQLSVLNKPTLSFTPGLVGEYTFNLTVNDGKEDSDPDKVKVTASTPDTNRAPSADAGLPKTIRVGEETTLSGTGSDPDNDPLAFTWAISKPLGSIDIMPSNNDIPNLTFTPDVEGAYTFSLFVDDGQENSETSTVIYTAQTPETNNKPIADSGFDRNVNAGEQVELQGSGSDQNQDTLTFRWSIVKMPENSGIFLSNPNIQNPNFVPDVIGTYTFQLIVNDGKEDSNIDKVNIHAVELQQCPAGICDLNTRQWCNNGVWSNVGYCRNCGDLDITCKRCVGRSCDIINQKWCEDNTWKEGTYSQYCSHCSYTDTNCPVCEENNCDIDHQRWCDSSRWSTIGYCGKCGKFDVSCEASCENSACNTKDSKVCNNGVWQESDYCISCGGKDSSCVFECLNNACDTKNQKWCDTKVWRSTDYCSQCGSKDVSCGATCSNQVCDVTSNRWCDSGSWSSLEYCDHCQDTECLDTCVNGACDVNVKKWCNNGAWSDVDYCDNCGTKDSSCLVACEENTCDTTANKRCTNGIWLSANYCDYCTLEDSDCTISCAEGECDRVNRKVCKNGEWVESLYVDLCVVQEIIVPVRTCNDYGNCTVGSTCINNSECSSNLCYNDECARPTCDNEIKDGNETDVDCGGICESKCQLGRNCKAHRDCESNLKCVSGTCSETRPVDVTIPEEEKDSDGDGIPDEWELEHGLDISDPSDAYADFDVDGLTNIQEYTFGTNPNIADSDRDSVSDKEEIIRENTDPLDPVSKPGGIGGLLIWTVVLIVVFGAGSYAAYYYKDYLINLINPRAAGPIPAPRQMPLKGRYAPQRPVLKTAPKKTEIEEIIEKRRKEKKEKREKLLKTFTGKSAPKQRKTSSTKEGFF